jgi:hypothetical protein
VTLWPKNLLSQLAGVLAATSLLLTACEGLLGVDLDDVSHGETGGTGGATADSGGGAVGGSAATGGGLGAGGSMGSGATGGASVNGGSGGASADCTFDENDFGDPCVFGL